MSCAHGGLEHVSSRFAGKVSMPEASKVQEKPCLLEIYQEGAASATRQRRVPAQFAEQYVLNPGRYFIAISCDGHTGGYKSGVFEIKDMRYDRTPMDLGEVVLR